MKGKWRGPMVAMTAGLMAATGCGSPTEPEPTAEATWIALTAGVRHACALASDGVAWCWGANDFGQLGDGTQAGRATPAKVAGTLRFTQLDAGDETTCGLTADGEVYCWGRNDTGQVGDGSPIDRVAPSRVPGGPFRSLSVGSYLACGVHVDGSTWCWGGDRYDAMLDGETDVCPAPYAAAFWRCSQTPRSITGLGDLVSLSIGTFHMCGLTSTGAVRCRGLGGFGQLGSAGPHLCDSGVPASGSSAPCAKVPVAVPELRLLNVSAGATHTCGVADTGRAYCWGGQILSFGQLGHGVADGSVAPVLVSGSASFARVAAAGVNLVFTFTCGLERDGRAFCWGAGGDGQLGSPATAQCGSTACATTPQEVPGPRFARLAAGGAFACGVGLDDDVYCWGRNANGQLGDGTTFPRSAPAPVRFPVT